MYFVRNFAAQGHFKKNVSELILQLLPSRCASTYEGEGKTSARSLNKELDYLMIDAYSNVGFCLNNGARLLGPSIIFPRSFLSWNVTGIDQVNENSLILFSLLHPKLDLLVVGIGDQNLLSNHVRKRLNEFSNKYHIGMEILPTDTAVATFNFLNNEKRYIAGAFIPPLHVDTFNDRELSMAFARQRLIDME